MADRPGDETLNKLLWSIPNVLCLIGSRAGDEWNGMTQSWVTQVAMEPVLVAVSVDVKAVTNRLMREGGSFTVNLWPRDDTRTFVKFSKPAVKEDMTLNGRPIAEAPSGAPYFTEAVAYLDCRVWNVVECGTHDLFIGEVTAGAFITEDDDPLVARIEDTRMKYGGVKRGGH